VDKAFLKFDKDGSGYITGDDLRYFFIFLSKKLKYSLNIRGVYNVSFHPKVRKGEMTEDQVFLEFLQSFGDVNKDGKITRQVNFWEKHSFF